MEYNDNNCKFGIGKIVFAIGCVLLCFILVLLGCGQNKEEELETVALPPVIESGPVQEPEPDITPDYMFPEQMELKGNYSSYYEAYLDVLVVNEFFMTGNFCDPRLSDMLDIGDGKIAIMDVFGDKTPELLYIYFDGDFENNFGFMESLKIYTYTNTDELVSLCDVCVCRVAGGSGYYCIYLTKSGKLYAYYARGDLSDSYGFFPIGTLSLQEEIKGYIGNDADPTETMSKAELYFIGFYEAWDVPQYSQKGQAISEKQFFSAAESLMSNIDQVVFQNDELGWYAYQDFWNEIVPFVASCITYDEAKNYLSKAT